MQVLAICGVPGTGKTGLAKQLAARTGLAVLAKDALMRSLLEYYEANSLTHLRTSVGPLAMHVAFSLITAQPALQTRLILDAPLWHREAWAQMACLISKGTVSIAAIICAAPAEIVAVRIASRHRIADRIRPQSVTLSAQEIEARHHQIERWSSELAIPTLVLNTDSNPNCVLEAEAFMEACFGK